MIRSCCSFFMVLILLGCNADKENYKSMVVSAHPEATKIGIDILKNGGNAIDAAVAVEYALAVCYHSAGNLGGGGFMVYRSSEGEYATLDYRETAPLKAYEKMYQDTIGNIIPRLSLDGGLAVGVPGSVHGIFEKHAKYGSKSMSELIQPAIDLAKNGFPITAKQAKRFNQKAPLFNKISPQTNYLRQIDNWKEGDSLVQKDFAKTLERIKAKGLKGFYEGETATQIVKSIKDAGGIMTLADLKNYKSIWRKPIVTNYKDLKVISMAPPSSGGVTLAQMLKMLEPFQLDTFEHNSAEYIHLLTEVERRAYADRNKHLGDPDFHANPIKSMLDENYLASKMDDFDSVATRSSEITAGIFKGNESEETTHFSILDKEGNAVSITTTLNSSYGSKLFVQGCGFLLNNEMDDFSSKPGVMNQYGLIGQKANSIQPNKRMLSSMTPTIVEKNGRLYMIVGSPGGSTIITSVLQNILNVYHFNMTMQESVDAPRFHHQWLPDLIYFEKERFDSVLFYAIEEKEHHIKERNSIGRVNAIRVKEDLSVEGGADSRGDDYKMGILVQ